MDWVALIGAVLGTTGAIGGITALIKAIKDWRDGKAQHEDQIAVRERDNEARHIERLEKQIATQGDRISVLESRLTAEREHSARLILALVRAGIDVPRD